MKVTIIVPVYNAEKTINKCVASILSQSYRDFELMLINDGSKDNSLKVIKKIKDDRITIIDKENEGVAKTRNFGIRKAKGEYIMFVDNDDFIEKDCLKNFVDNLDNCDVIMGGYKRVSNKGTIFTQKLADTIWSRYIVMAPWSKLYRKDFLIKNNIEFLDYKIGEDVYFNMQVLTKTAKIKTIPTMDYNWFYNDESVSNTIQKGLNEEVDITILLNNIISLDNFFDNEYNVFYIKRYVIWYLLFSGKESTSKEFMKEYHRLNNWKKEKNIKSKIGFLSPKLKGEPIKFRMACFVFSVFDKLHMIGLFSKIYCKGKDA